MSSKVKIMNKSYIIEESYNPQSRFDKPYEKEFWKHKKLEELSKDEWELLCDGCGKCCLNKLEIRNKIKYTNAACRFLDCKTCLCKIYENRFEKVPDCVDIDINAVRIKPCWMPRTCAYWLLDNGYDLPPWHPLITGKASTVHDANMSIKNRYVISETEVKNYENHLVDWEDI